jgi:broad specificity phosphatase PhoE/predicted kinase
MANGPRSERTSIRPSGKIVFVMVGLPARGKTFMARKVARYLSWLGHRTHVFNVGAYRRERLGSQQHHSFFDPDNEAGHAARLELALGALEDMLEWLSNVGDIAIYDATNSTRERRRELRARCEAEGLQVVFIESVCNDPATVEANIRETKAHSPDYAGFDPEEAVRDFRMRIAHYEEAYETVGDEEGSYIKVIDVGDKVIAHQIEGYLPSRVVSFLLNAHIEPRSIWITRHGESEFNVLGRIGGDAPLSRNGVAYAESLGEFVRHTVGSPLTVWTSTLRRTTETADHLELPYRKWRALDEIDAGICDGMTYAEIAEKMSSEYAARAADKLRYRYPRGESYEDVIQRLEPVIFELERLRAPVLVIGHQAVLRALYGYLMDEAPEACPRIPIPLHTVIRLTPTAYGCEVQRFALAPTPPTSTGTYGSDDPAHAV